MTGETFHLVAAEYFEASDPTTDYVPEGFAADGFIHCTDGLENVIDTANRYCSEDPRPYLLLTIDTECVKAEVRYEDVERIYPHIYGALNRDAIVRVAALARAADGSFLPRDSQGRPTLPQ